MNNKKMMLAFIGVIIVLLTVLVPDITKAATPLTPSVYFGVNEFRTGTTPENMAYAIGNPLDNESTTESIVGTKIWQIVKYNSSTGGNFDTGDYYCVRSGVGFSDANTKAEYNMSYDFTTEKETIANSGSSVLQSIVNNGYYYNLLALADLLYLKETSTEEEKAELFANAYIGSDYYDYSITDSDIEAVQQAAIWYYTNHDDELFDKIFDNMDINKTSWLTYRTLEMSQDGDGYTSLSDYNYRPTGEGLDRQEQANKLYRYLINTANANAASYENGTAYSRSKITLYTNSTVEQTQPIVLIERTPDTREFDLALRKYIVSVAGTTVANTRIPNIDISTIATEETATYKHRKDPVTVKTGDEVVYRLTVYNEGEKAGRVTKIVDQLPTGLTSDLVTGNTLISTKGNTYTVTYDTATNRITFETTGTQNLNAFDGSTLDSDTIEVDCTVTATANSNSAVTLTNVAWIAEEYDAISKKTITNVQGEDRDSEPATTPQVNKDNMSNYRGNTSNKSTLNDSTYFYKGEQDDDDFEKLVIPKQNEGSYDLVLVKQNENGAQLNSQATFTVNGETKQVTGSLVVVDDKKITSDNVTANDSYIIKETAAPNGYSKFEHEIEVTVTKKLEGDIYKVDKVTYKIINSDGEDITETAGKDVNVRLDENSATIYVEVKNYKEGVYDVVLVKEDENGSQLNSQATFTVNNESKQVTGRLTVANDVKITAENVGESDSYTIKETVAPNGYSKFDGTITVTVSKKLDGNTYKVNDVTYKVTDAQGQDITTAVGDNVEVQFDSASATITVEIKNRKNGQYDLVLVKQDENGAQLDSTATFTVNNETKQVTGSLIVADNVQITSDNVNATDEYIIKETVAPDGYSKFDGTITVTVSKKLDGNIYKVNDVTYKVTDGQNQDITQTVGENVNVHFEENSGTIYVEVKNNKNGQYDLVLVKQDEEGTQLDSKATFTVNDVIKEVTGSLVVADDVQITSDNVNATDEYTIKETVAPDGYGRFDGSIVVTVLKQLDGNTYKLKNVSFKILDVNGNDITSSKSEDIKMTVESNNVITVYVKNYQFDLKLVKRITEVNGEKVPERIEGVDITNLANGTKTTAEYNLNKEPVSVKRGDIVKYTLRIYNEGGVDGYASEISEDIPEGLEFIWSEETDSSVIEADETLTELEKEAILYNQLVWRFDAGDIDTETNRVELVKTDYLAKGKGAETTTDGANLIKAFDKTRGYVDVINDKNPDYKEVSVYLRVVSENKTSTIIRNEAAITEDTDSEGNPIKDRDSDTEEWVKYEDDEDYDNVILESFDLALRKFIIAVSGDETIEETEYIRNEDGSYARAPEVDTSKLNTEGENGEIITTATYNHTKEPIEVLRNDYVVYMMRVYNEGEIDGYASEITDHLPEYLEYVDNEYNRQYGWEVSEDGRTVTTKYLDNHIIAKAEQNEEGEYVLSYREVPIMCRVKEEAEGKITNIAEITENKDDERSPIDDRDSEEDNVELPTDSELPNYKDEETGEYIPGQEDDDDFEKVVVKDFDLALRKFITAVGENEVTTRVPEVVYDEENDKITYEHAKDPVDVVTGNIVTYTIRVYNEGEVDGYASEITDDIPDGLRYLPDHELNQEYRWVMYDAEGNITENVEEAVEIRTDYLSKEQGEARMAENEELTENPALLKAFDREGEITETNPDYADVKVAFEVIEPNESSKIIVNAAQISEDTNKDGNPVDDIDSIPDEWNEGEDDQDNEYIKLNYFDLSLRKWVTHAIVIEDGKETVTETGHTAEDAPEQVVKVEIHRKEINSVTVKFRYSIRITNEGDIAGYATEITDYVPEGLRFVAEDNPDWTDEGNNIISTRKLENTLLQPGESAEVEVVLTWINGNDNLGLKTNIAEISEDYNEPGVPDRDSTPDNQVPGEDDIDDAPVLLSVSTGEAKVYVILGISVLITIASGIVLIKKFVI